MTPDPATAEYTCPHCGLVFAVSIDASGEFACPYCDGTTMVDASSVCTDERVRADADEPLNAEHIRRLTKLGRAANRSHAYAIVAAIACLAAMLESILMAARMRLRGEEGWMTIWLLIALLPAAGTITCLLRARGLRREGIRPIPEPPSPPDFSALGDGSQRRKAFEDFTT